MLLAFVGLATDTGVLYINYAHARRAVDSAALGAATQVRETTKTQQQITDIARQYIILQGLDVATVAVDTCVWKFTRNPVTADVNLDAQGRFVSFKDDAPSDVITNPAGLKYKDYTDICTFPSTKKVRVTASINSETAFLHIVGWNSITLNASATTEAASLEIVLIIDTSYSMTFDVAIDNEKDDDGDGCADETTTVPGGVPGSYVNGVPLIPCSDGNSKNDDWLRAQIGGAGADQTEPECTWHIYGDTNDLYRPEITSIFGLLPAKYPSGCTALGAGCYSPFHVCRPFEFVRDAAIRFVDKYVYFPYDRVSIITFSNQVTLLQSIGVEGVSDNKSATLGHLIGYLKATDASGTKVWPTQLGETGQRLDVSGNPICTGDDWAIRPGYCEATNTGGALAKALEVLSSSYIRQNALRYIILLSDGAATSSNPNVASAVLPSQYACPYTINSGAVGPPTQAIYDQYYYRRPCQDGNSQTRYASSSPLYDADDYARDQAKAVADSGNNIIIFTIGLGSEVTQNPGGGANSGKDCTGALNGTQWSPCNLDLLPNGEQLLRYIADQGDGVNKLGLDPCQRNDTPVGNPTVAGYRYNYPIGKSCGNYYYAQGGLDLTAVFEAIAQRIFTRITR
ncbi:MAG: hypothetical protein HZC38_19055 [Chloroflexi bacterium]|nr:hypothetical protein [Chloroflexota bacterium]